MVAVAVTVVNLEKAAAVAAVVVVMMLVVVVVVVVVIKDKSKKSILSNYLDWSCSYSNMRSMLECI